MIYKKIFLQILESYIHPTKQQIYIENMSEEEWKELLNLSAIHSVVPIIHESVWQNESYQKLPEQVKSSLKQFSKIQIIRQSQYTAFFIQLYRVFLKNNLKVLVIKGLILRDMYQNPDYRVSGDEDILVKQQDFRKVDEMLYQCGFIREAIEDPEDQHEISYYHRGNGFHLELHLTLFPIESDAYGKLNDDFQNIFERSVVENIQDTEIYTLNPTQHMLYLFCHGLKHFLHSGFGIRQLCDMVLFAEKYNEDICWNEIIQILKEEQMYVFVMNLLDIGEKHLGFSWEKAGLQKTTEDIFDSEKLLEDLLAAGVYGKSDEDRNHSANITLQAVQTRKEFEGIRHSLFPQYSYMCTQYSYLKKYRFLLPIAWISRIITYLTKTKKNSVKKTVEIGKQRVDLLRKYKIID